MRKIVFGFLWFFVLWLGGLTVGGVVVGGLAGARVQNSQQGYIAGRAAGEEFGKKYGTPILIGAALAASGGAASGFLPGTRKKKSAAA